MDHITLDAADAVELIEILNCFMEALDCVAEHDSFGRLIAGLGTYEISDLRADVERLTHRLQRSEMGP